MPDALETENLFYRYNTAADALYIDALLSDLTHCRNQETKCYRAGNHARAEEWGKKAAAVVAELAKRGYTEGG